MTAGDSAAAQVRHGQAEVMMGVFAPQRTLLLDRDRRQCMVAVAEHLLRRRREDVLDVSFDRTDSRWRGEGSTNSRSTWSPLRIHTYIDAFGTDDASATQERQILGWFLGLVVDSGGIDA